MTDLVGPAGSNGNLYTLACFKDHLSESTIETVQIPYLLKSGARNKLIRIARGGKWEAISRQAIIIVMRQTVDSKGFVGNVKPTRLENVNLIL